MVPTAFLNTPDISKSCLSDSRASTAILLPISFMFLTLCGGSLEAMVRSEKLSAKSSRALLDAQATPGRSTLENT